jgi:endonuclease-3
MKPAQIHTFFATLQAANTHPVTELENTRVFELLAAVLLSSW